MEQLEEEEGKHETIKKLRAPVPSLPESNLETTGQDPMKIITDRRWWFPAKCFLFTKPMNHPGALHSSRGQLQLGTKPPAVVPCCDKFLMGPPQDARWYGMVCFYSVRLRENPQKKTISPKQCVNTMKFLRYWLHHSIRYYEVDRRWLHTWSPFLGALTVQHQISTIFPTRQFLELSSCCRRVRTLLSAAGTVFCACC